MDRSQVALRNPCLPGESLAASAHCEGLKGGSADHRTWGKVARVAGAAPRPLSCFREVPRGFARSDVGTAVAPSQKHMETQLRSLMQHLPATLEAEGDLTSQLTWALAAFLMVLVLPLTLP